MSDVDAHSVTAGQYLGDWLAGKHALNPKTAALYRDALDHCLVPHLGSIRRIHAALRSALNAAVKRRLIPYNPALHIELAAENRSDPSPGPPSRLRPSSTRHRTTGSQRSTDSCS
jgi:hypothetical protein